MNLDYLTTTANWWGPTGILHRIHEHLDFTVTSMVIALAIAMPIAIATGHTGRMGFLAINVSNIGRAVPSIAFLGLASQLLPHGYDSTWPTIIALVLLALPPLVTNTYVGMREADKDAVDAARGMGMAPTQVAMRVEFPLALPLVMAGVRTSVTNVIATATLAALVAQGGLGRLIVDGQVNDNSELVANVIRRCGRDRRRPAAGRYDPSLSPVARAGSTGRVARLRRARRRTSCAEPVGPDRRSNSKVGL